MEKLSRIKGLRVLAIKEGIEVGAISEFVVDQEEKTIKFVVIDTGQGCFGLQVLPVEAISGMGQDFATTATKETVTNVWETEEAMELAFTDADIVGARVVSSTGDVLGKIKDFEFDAEDGLIKTFVMEDGTTIDKDAIYTLSRKIVFVDKDIMDEQTKEQSQQEDVVAPPVTEAIEAPQTGETIREPEVIEELGDFSDVSEEEPTSETARDEAVSTQSKEDIREPEVIEELGDFSQVSEEEPTQETARQADIIIGGEAQEDEAQEQSVQESAESTQSYFQQRRSEFLLGKTISQDILDNDGNLIAAKNSVVDQDILDKVTQADKMVELTMSVN